jgi:hypothetical protein
MAGGAAVRRIGRIAPLIGAGHRRRLADSQAQVPTGAFRRFALERREESGRVHLQTARDEGPQAGLQRGRPRISGHRRPRHIAPSGQPSFDRKRPGSHRLRLANVYFLLHAGSADRKGRLLCDNPPLASPGATAPCSITPMGLRSLFAPKPQRQHIELRRIAPARGRLDVLDRREIAFQGDQQFGFGAALQHLA